MAVLMASFENEPAETIGILNYWGELFEKEARAIERAQKGKL